jgi:hypothetical protein
MNEELMQNFCKRFSMTRDEAIADMQRRGTRDGRNESWRSVPIHTTWPATGPTPNDSPYVQAYWKAYAEAQDAANAS